MTLKLILASALATLVATAGIGARVADTYLDAAVRCSAAPACPAALPSAALLRRHQPV